MKTRFILLGVSGILSITAFNLGAQDADPATDPAPASNANQSLQPPKPTLVPVMKNTELLEKLKAASGDLSTPVQEIAKMSESGTDAAVIQAYVENSPVAYNLKADEILYLNNHGVSSAIITAMIQHGAKLREEAGIAQANAPAPPAQAPPASESSYAVDSGAPVYAASPTYAYPTAPVYYPSYAYSYPSYYYPWYPSVGVFLSRPFYYGRPHGAYYGHSFGGGARFSHVPGRASSHTFGHH